MTTPHSQTITFEQLADQVAGMESERSITQLMYRYGRAIDENDLASYVDCFTADGVWVSQRPNGMSTRFQGRVEFAEFIRRHTTTDEWRMKHITVHPSITLLNENEATAHSYFIRIDTDHDRLPSYIWAMGHYLDRFKRCDDGAWRFAERRVIVEDRHSAPQ